MEVARTVEVRALPVIAAMLVLVPAGGTRETPGAVTYDWVVRWPAAGQELVRMRAFAAPPGLLRRVDVAIGGQRVPAPPYHAVVGCRGTRQIATAQRAWLWGGKRVHVLLLLRPGRCAVAGTLARARVTLTSVGT